MNDETSGSERRRFFRVDDDIIFDYHLLDQPPKSSGEVEDDPLKSVSRIALALKQLDKEHLQQYHYVMNSEPKLGEYLHMINQKVDLIFHFLSQEIFAKVLLHADQRATTRVNISAGGMGFRARDAVAPGKILLLKFLLRPSYDYIVTEGRVVGCAHQADINAEHPYRISIEYLKLSPADEQKIVYHIQRLEIALQQAKRAPEDRNL